MFNLGAGEVVLILVVALLVLGPKRLPELARGIGKFMREFRRQTDEVRSVVEREFYRMDQDLNAEPDSNHILPVQAPRPPAALMAEASAPGAADPKAQTESGPGGPPGTVPVQKSGDASEVPTLVPGRTPEGA